MKKEFSLLVFDWDGTLVDSIERIVTSLQHASKQALRTDISETQAKNVIGLGLMEAIKQLHPELDCQQHGAELEMIADHYRQHYLYDNPIPAPLFPGVKELLHELKHQDYTLAIATGKSRAGLDRSMSENKISDYFAMTRCATESKSKPDPQMLHEILKQLNFTNTQTLMIGDSEHDLKMAQNAAVKSIGVTHGVHDEETLNKFEPLICLQDITDLHHFLSTN